MEKAKVYMSNWEVYVYKDKYNLSGIADYHPRLGKNFPIAYTSTLVKHSFEDDVLIYETLNTIYICPLKYMVTEPYNNVIPKYKEKLVHRADNSDSWLDRIIAASAKLVTGINLDDDFVKHILELTEIGKVEIAEKNRVENERLISIAEQYEDCIYLEVSNIESGNKLAYHLGKDSGIVIPDIHTGMFQDSILYMKYRFNEDDCALDFRYFPKGFGCMKTYSWSDNIRCAVIKNDMQEIMEFNGESIIPGDVKVFTTETHRQGLVSPDCYNGKSLLL